MRRPASDQYTGDEGNHDQRGDREGDLLGLHAAATDRDAVPESVSEAGHARRDGMALTGRIVALADLVRGMGFRGVGFRAIGDRVVGDRVVRYRGVDPEAVLDAEYDDVGVASILNHNPHDPTEPLVAGAADTLAL